MSILIQNITWSEAYNKSTLSIWNLASSRHELKEHIQNEKVKKFSKSSNKKERERKKEEVLKSLF